MTSALYLTNSLSGQKELFSPIDAANVRMYVCGPTVYDRVHIGNGRSLVVYDVLYRLLQHIHGDKAVTYVRNITDVDDKINARSKELGISIFELTSKTIADFWQDTKYLGCLEPTVQPKATQHITQMLQMIQILLENSCAYEKNGTVYFDVTSYKDYGKLANRSLDDMLAGVRVEVDANKRSNHDFVLWKPADDGDDESSCFDSPWGKGWPGWHIECSSMAHHYLGQNFDIHGGGVDLIFPHHTNEIAQSCCAFPGSFYAKYWVHNGFLKSGGEKMSKSVGNFFTAHDMREKGVSTSVIRYALLNTHYHKPIEFNDNVLREATENVKYLARAAGQSAAHNHEEFTAEFFAYLLDDLNTHSALNHLLKIAKTANKTLDIKAKESIKYCCNFLGLLSEEKAEEDGSEIEKINQLVAQRDEAKRDKNWPLADKIRNELDQMGISLQDAKNMPTKWERR